MEISQSINSKKNTLKKHTALIHSSNPLTLIQRKVANALLAHAYHELMDEEVHTIAIADLCRLIDFSSHNQALLKDALKTLMSTIIEWNIINEEIVDQAWTASTMLASVSIKGSLCEYAYAPHLRELIHNPHLYGQVNLAVQAKFKSVYGLALYENCIRYRGVSQTRWFDLDLFKKLMGVSQGSYKTFRDLKRRVIDRAVDEVNTYSDIRIKTDMRRQGRVVKAIKFYIEPRRRMHALGRMQGLVKEKQNKKLNNNLLNRLVEDYKFSTDAATSLVDLHGIETLTQKINYIDNRKIHGEEKIKYAKSYLKAILKSERSTLLSQQREKEIIYNKNKEREKIEKYESFYQIYLTEIVIKNFLNLSSSKKSKLIEEFYKCIEMEKRCSAPIIIKHFKESGLSSDLNKRDFAEYLIKYYPNLKNDALSLNEFINNQD